MVAAQRDADLAGGVVDTQLVAAAARLQDPRPGQEQGIQGHPQQRAAHRRHHQRDQPRAAQRPWPPCDQPGLPDPS
ncbi:hypothetical protein QV12_00040, partial [Pseudomonas putida]